MFRHILFTACLVAIFPGVARSASEMPEDTAFQEYSPVAGLSGKLISAGSDTMSRLMTLWGEEFRLFYPEVNIEFQGAGSSTAPAALTDGKANLGAMSRPMTDDELSAFESRYGYRPTEVSVAIDAVAIYVNRDNPIRGFTIPQVDAIFSSTRRCGHPTDIRNWGELGLGGEWAVRGILLYGRNAASGSHAFVKEYALCNGSFKETLSEQPGSATVVQAVGKSLNGVGYASIGYMTSHVRAVPLAYRSGEDYLEPTMENAISGAYPLARLLYLYVNKNPSAALAPLEREFLRFVLCRVGQRVVSKSGHIPLPAPLAARQLDKLLGENHAPSR